MEKVYYPPKKPKVMTGPNTGETLAKLLVKPGPKVGKGMIKGLVPVTKKHPILLREDSSYVLKYISSIFKDDDYSRLDNHVTEAMGETGLFSLT